jgi:TolA-binding protein
LLDAYVRTYPDGTLGPEAEILRIDALAQGGQRAMARLHAEAFVRRYPSSVLAARARQYLAD